MDLADPDSCRDPASPNQNFEIAACLPQAGTVAANIKISLLDIKEGYR
jgi:hypothetical protein